MASSAATVPGADESAIHDNVDAEIAGITEKTAPALADLLIVEDSEASNAKKRIQIVSLPFSPIQNFIRNPNFLIAQRAVTFTAATTPHDNANDKYLIDGWINQTDGADVVDVSRDQANTPANTESVLKLLVATVDKKFGHLQMLEKPDTQMGFDGGVASFSFVAARTGSSLVNIRAAIVMFTTSGVAVSDIVSTWNAEGVNPTLASDWVFAGTPVALSALTVGFQTYKIENVTVPSGFTVGVFFWSDETTTTLGDAIYFSQMKLEPGPVATPYANVQRFDKDPQSKYYYQKLGKGTSAQAISTTSLRVWGEFGIVMRATPTMTLLELNPQYLQGVNVRTGSGSTLSSVAVTPRGFTANMDGFTGLTVNEVAVLNGDVVFEFDAEI